MNYKAIVLIAAVIVGCVGAANGQLLKKLGERAEKAAERTILNRTDREVSKGTDKAIDEALGAGKKKEKDASKEKGGAEDKDTDVKDERKEATESALSNLSMYMGGNMDDVPDAYSFSYRATMKIINEGEEETIIQYWLEPDAAYLGTKSLVKDAANHIAVMDMENKAMVMFMDDGTQKTAMRINADQKILGKYMKEAGESEDTDDVTMTPIENKTILGYHCKGFQVESEDGTSKVWVTDEAPVGMFSGAVQGDYIPKGMPNFGSKALLMEMEYMPKKGKKDRIRMVCTELKPESLVIRKADYRPMGGN